jgi:hypothetical protein
MLNKEASTCLIMDFGFVLSASKLSKVSTESSYGEFSLNPIGPTPAAKIF